MTPAAGTAAAQVDAVLAKLVDMGLVASPDDASLYARDEEIRSNQGNANPWVVGFFDRTGSAALAFIRPASPLRESLRALTAGGTPVVRTGDGPVRREILSVRAGSAAALEQALADRGECLVRGTGPDGDEVSVAVCSPLSLLDALSRIRRIALDCTLP